MSEAAVAREIAPIGAAGHAGQSRARHAFGLGATPPFCDGSHRPARPRPAVFKAGPDGAAHLCGCEASRGGRHCDGSHPQL
jgi:CDGSH-type Zn-finger protein